MGAGRVFISYAHESERHRARVLALANRLRADGIDARIDRYSAPPLTGWTRWMEREITEAQWILLVYTETYRRRFDLEEEPGKGRGVAWEARIVRGALYDKPNGEHRCVPVTFSHADAKHIPLVLRDAPSFHLDDDYAALQRHLLRAAEIPLPPLGGSSPAPPPRVVSVPVLHVQSEGVRDELRRAPATHSRKATRRVLIVAANRDRDGRLALGREVREIASALRGPSRLAFDIHIVWAATERDFRQAFLAVKPHILHFCGHGTSAGPVLEQAALEDEALDGDALRRWLNVAVGGSVRPLEIAILNFCDSHEMLDSLAGAATLVVGPTRSILDEHAIIFSTAFYMALAAGGTGSFAYYLGKSAVEMTPVATAQARDIVATRSLSFAGYGIRCRSPVELALLGDAGHERHRTPTFAFFASEPDGLARLRLDRQLRSILDGVPSRSFRVEQRWATRVVDFLHTLILARPTIVHLSGHGEAGGFVFEHDRHPEGVLASSRAVTRVLTAFHQDVECAVLMFGQSAGVAHALDGVLDYVVAIEGELPDHIIRRFAELFYQMISAERSYRTAFEAACLALPAAASSGARFVLRGRLANVPGRAGRASRRRRAPAHVR